MKILLTHERFAPDFAGGGEYVVLETARLLLKRGIAVRVLTTGSPAIREHDGIPTVRLPVHRYRLNFAVRPIARLARDVDLIHTFNYHACLPSLLAGRRAGKPVVCSILGLFGAAWRELRRPPLAQAWMAWERFLLRRRFDRLIFHSDHSREQGIALGAVAERCLVNSPGIYLQDYAPAEPKDDVVLFVGKLEARKGIADVLAAAAALPHVCFQVMGWGPDRDRLRVAATANVEFPEFERGKKLQQAFARARLFVLPSRAETFGVAVLEAMAAGCAVISTVPLPFAGEQIRPGDRRGLIGAIDRLWADRQGSLEMGRRNLERAQDYTWERHAERLLEIYRDVLR